MSDEEDQENELLALENIYDETVFCSSREESRGGQFLACPYLPEPFFVKVSRAETDGIETNGGQNQEDLKQIEFLPPIVLNFQIPSNYPSEKAPDYTITCKWLTKQQLNDLCNELDRRWEENKGAVILYMWFSFLQDDAFNFVRIQNPLNLSAIHIGRQSSRKSSTTHSDVDCPEMTEYDDRGIQDIAASSMLLPAILDFNIQEKQRQFDRSVFPCKVCLNEKLGVHCIVFHGCDHVYCKDCMKGHFMVQISDGNINSLSCPEDKCETQAHPSQVKELVSPELFERYDRLLLKTSLDMMTDIAYCPRPSCECPVLIEKNGFKNMGSCPACHFTFCVLCKLCYHGLSPCKLKTNERRQLREQYLAADSAGRTALEKRYGKKAIDLAVAESFSTDWLNKYSKQCPKCTTHIQKIDGCNKMTCTKCGTYFCWICSVLLSRSNPYEHFNQRKSNCYNQLFLGMGDESDESDDEFDYLML